MPSVNVEGTMAIYDGYLYYFSVKPVNANELADNDYHTTVYCKRISIDGKSASETLGSFQFAMDYDLLVQVRAEKYVLVKMEYFMLLDI